MNEEKVWANLCERVGMRPLPDFDSPGEVRVIRPANVLRHELKVKQKNDKARKAAKKARRRNRR